MQRFASQYFLHLFLIILLALALRLYQIGIVPVSLNRDEVGLGYDAYMLLKTGRDQYNKFLPLTLRSSDDYKPALYAYLSVPVIGVLGLHEQSTRLTSALTGSLTIFILYFLVIETLKNHREFTVGREHKIALLAAFILAISPWHIQYSRGAYEVNLALFFLTSGILHLYKSRYSKTAAILAGIFLGLSLLAYHSARFIAPILLLQFFFLQRNKLMIGNFARIAITFAFFLLLVVPNILSREQQIRFEVLNIFVTDNMTNRQYWQNSSLAIEQDLRTGVELSSRVVHNRRLATLQYINIKTLLYNSYLHLSPQFLLIGDASGSRERNHAPSHGLMYPWEFLLFIVGSIIFIRSYLSRFTSIYFTWFVAGLFAASLSWDSPNSWRSLIFLPSLVFFSTSGLAWVFDRLERIAVILRKIFYILLTSLFAWTFFIYLHRYFVHLNIETSREWRYGRREAVLLTETLRNSYKKIIVSTKLDDPHLYFLFYLRYDPVKYLAEGGTISGGWTATQNHFANYEFKPIDFLNQSKETNVLFIGLPEDFPSFIKPLHTIYYLNGEEALRIVAT